jgi:hypothetical protein
VRGSTQILLALGKHMRELRAKHVLPQEPVDATVITSTTVDASATNILERAGVWRTTP